MGRRLGGTFSLFAGASTAGAGRDDEVRAKKPRTDGASDRLAGSCEIDEKGVEEGVDLEVRRGGLGREGELETPRTACSRCRNNGFWKFLKSKRRRQRAVSREGQKVEWV